MKDRADHSKDRCAARMRSSPIDPGCFFISALLFLLVLALLATTCQSHGARAPQLTKRSNPMPIATLIENPLNELYLSLCSRVTGIFFKFFSFVSQQPHEEIVPLLSRHCTPLGVYSAKRKSRRRRRTRNLISKVDLLSLGATPSTPTTLSFILRSNSRIIPRASKLPPKWKPVSCSIVYFFIFLSFTQSIAQVFVNERLIALSPLGAPFTEPEEVS